MKQPTCLEERLEECWDRQPSKPLFTLEDVEEILGQEENREEYSKSPSHTQGIRNQHLAEQRQRLSEKLEKL